jgi:hypothetical protein
VSGVGQSKLAKYGQEVLTVLAEDAAPLRDDPDDADDTDDAPAPAAPARRAPMRAAQVDDDEPPLPDEPYDDPYADVPPPDEG